MGREALSAGLMALPGVSYREIPPGAPGCLDLHPPLREAPEERRAGDRELRGDGTGRLDFPGGEHLGGDGRRGAGVDVEADPQAGIPLAWHSTIEVTFLPSLTPFTMARSTSYWWSLPTCFEGGWFIATLFTTSMGRTFTPATSSSWCEAMPKSRRNRTRLTKLGSKAIRKLTSRTPRSLKESGRVATSEWMVYIGWRTPTGGGKR